MNKQSHFKDMRAFLVYIFLVTGLSTNAQNLAKTDTIFNQTDKQGLKQGFWKVRYDNGALKYTAFFKNDKPVGVMKRYFEDNTLKAVMVFDKTSTISRTKLYYQDGPIAAEGNYVKSAKDSTWSYFSYYTKTISNRETYIHGRREGTSTSYFSTGKIAEESDWTNGIRNGTWRQYWENGSLKMATSFINGKRNGDFIIYYPENTIEWKGAYVNDIKEGKWIQYDPDGGVIVTIEYKNGIATNAAELDAKEQESLKLIEKQKGKIPEPDETNFMDKPVK